MRALALAICAASALAASPIRPAAIYLNAGTTEAFWQPDAPIIEAFPAQTGFEFANELFAPVPPAARPAAPAIFALESTTHLSAPGLDPAAAVAHTPEPATAWLVAIGAFGVWLGGRRYASRA